jgi:hypothetical protein
VHREFLIRAGVALLSSSALLGCSGQTDPLAVWKQGVLGGEPTGSNQAGVLYVTSEVRNLSNAAVVKIGSGSLVAPNLVMTALHVVSRNPSNVPFTCDASGNAVSGGSGALLGPTVSPEKVTIYAGPLPNDEPIAHGTQIVSSGSTTICENDIAFVVLDTALDLPSYPIHRGAPVDVGARLTVIGYGSTAEEPSGEVTRTEREVDVTAIGQWIRTFTVSEGPCEGDSGGPALSRDTEVVGVFSSVSADCAGPTAAAKYTDVSYFASLVEQAFEAAGAGSPWSQGEGAENPVDLGGAGQSAEIEPAEGGGGAAGAPLYAPTVPKNRDAGCAMVALEGGSKAVRWFGAAAALLFVGARWGRQRKHHRMSEAK